ARFSSWLGVPGGRMCHRASDFCQSMHIYAGFNNVLTRFGEVLAWCRSSTATATNARTADAEGQARSDFAPRLRGPPGGGWRSADRPACHERSAQAPEGHHEVLLLHKNELG